MTDGFDAFGHSVSDHRRDVAYQQAREMGLDAEHAMEAVSKIARAIEDDRPATVLGHENIAGLDLTGRYRLISVLCTAPEEVSCPSS